VIGRSGVATVRRGWNHSEEGGDFLLCYPLLYLHALGASENETWSRVGLTSPRMWWGIKKEERMQE